MSEYKLYVKEVDGRIVQQLTIGPRQRVPDGFVEITDKEKRRMIRAAIKKVYMDRGEVKPRQSIRLVVSDRHMLADGEDAVHLQLKEGPDQIRLLVDGVALVLRKGEIKALTRSRAGAFTIKIADNQFYNRDRIGNEFTVFARSANA